MRNYTNSLQAICTLDFSGREQFDENEKELVKFVVELSKLPLSEKDHKFISTTFHTISDMERVGDHFINMGEMVNEW